MRGLPARLVALPVLAMLAACGSEAEENAPADPAVQPATAAALIECAIAGAQPFKRECAVEQMRDSGVLTLTVRHPDGGFRRFEVLTDGHGIATADGAELAQTEVAGGGLDVAVGSDRYRFPATIRGHERTQ